MYEVVPDLRIELQTSIIKPSLITDVHELRLVTTCTRLDGLGGTFNQNIGIYVDPEIDWHRELIEIELLRRI